MASEETADRDEAVAAETLGREETRRALHALLFVSDRPMSAGRLAQALDDADPHVVANLLEELRE